MATLSHHILRTISLLGAVALFAPGCGVEQESEARAAAAVIGGKADRISECSQIVDQQSPDISVLGAHLIGRIAPQSATVSADFRVDCGACDELDRAPVSNSCDGFDECQNLTLDCRREIEGLIDLPLVSTATFDNVFYTKVTYSPDAPVNEAGSTVERYYDQYFNCNVLEITTVSRSAALPAAQSVGFYFDGQLTVIPMGELTPTGTVTLKSGEEGTLHKFGALALCWRGTMSSSIHARYEFKPFLRFTGDDQTCTNNWDSVPENYLISSAVTDSFDRSAELLQ